jgi:hypothetical protein
MPRYAVVEYSEMPDGSLSVRYTVTGAEEKLEFYQVYIPYNGEESQVFLSKLRNFMVAQVAFEHNKRTILKAMQNFSFTDPTINFTLGA